MRSILIILALCLPVRAHNWQRPATPYTRTVTIPWTRIPYPNCDFQVKQRDGQTWTITNPHGFGCEFWFTSGDVFQSTVLVDPLTLTIEIMSAHEVNPLW